jgi:hypothetical protein
MAVRLIYISVSKRYQCSCRHVTRRVLLTRQDLPTLPKHMKSLPLLSAVLFSFMCNGFVIYVSLDFRFLTERRPYMSTHPGVFCGSHRS